MSVGSITSLFESPFELAWDQRQWADVFAEPWQSSLMSVTKLYLLDAA